MIGESRSRSPRTLWLVGFLAAIVVATVGLPQVAWAHNGLIDTTPGDGKTVTKPPKSVVLTFNEPALKAGTKVLVSGPDGSVVDGDPKLVDNSVEQALVDDLPAGKYTVEWRVASADGHPITGEFSFRLKADPKPTPTPSTASPAASPSPSAATTTPAPTTTPTPATLPTQTDGDADGPSGWWWLLAIPVGLAGVLGWRFSRR